MWILNVYKHLTLKYYFKLVERYLFHTDLNKISVQNKLIRDHFEDLSKNLVK